MELFSITSIITALAAIGFGLSVYSSDPSSHIHRWWLALSVAIALWAGSLFGVTTAANEHAATFWQHPLDFFGALIPLLYLFFIVSFIGGSVRRWMPVTIATCAMIIISTLPQYKHTMTEQFGFYWVSPGPLYILFPVYFFVLVMCSVGLLLSAYHARAHVDMRARLRNQLIAGVIGFGGGMTNFFPQLFHVYPFGNYFVILYVFLVSYGVLRYKYMSPKLVSAQIFSGAVVLIFLFSLLQSHTLQEWFISLLLFVLALLFSAFLVRGVYIEVEQREQIERLSNEKSEFMTFASHEIRNPITRIQNYATLLLEGDAGTLDSAAKGTVEKVLVSTHDVLSLITQFLNKSKLELGQLQYARVPFDVGTLCAQVVGEFQPHASQKGLKLISRVDLSHDFCVVGDQQKTKEVLGILLDNSMKYTKEGSVSVSVESHNDTVLVSITDTGVGIPADVIPNLFKKFSRADAAKANLLGTGVGLYLAKTLIDGMGGRVWVESPGTGKGSTFFVQLPGAQSTTAVAA